MYMTLLLRALATAAMVDDTTSSQSKNLLEDVFTGIFTKNDKFFPTFTPSFPAHNFPPTSESSIGTPLIERSRAFSEEGVDLRFLTAVFEIPNLAKYLPTYLDWRDRNKRPFHSPLPNGPAPQDCKKHELIIARGAGELGDFGFIVGDPLFERVQRMLPGTQGYAVQYPGNVDDEPWVIGIKDVVRRLNTHSKKCPDTKFALAGYSQGAHIVREALASNQTNPLVLKDKVVGVALFGDPWLGGDDKVHYSYPNWTTIPTIPKVLERRVINNCAVSWNNTDWFCTNEDTQLYATALDEANGIIAHFTYNNPGGNYIENSAAHLVKQFKES